MILNLSFLFTCWAFLGQGNNELFHWEDCFLVLGYTHNPSFSHQYLWKKVWAISKPFLKTSAELHEMLFLLFTQKSQLKLYGNPSHVRFAGQNPLTYSIWQPRNIAHVLVGLPTIFHDHTLKSSNIFKHYASSWASPSSNWPVVHGVMGHGQKKTFS